jgi:undecaprenyl diphosphate synthase
VKTDHSIGFPGIQLQTIPKHVAIIMDGNGRWALARGLPRVAGHREGAQRVKEIVQEAGKLGVKALTLFAFSEENWRRPAGEVKAIFRLLDSYLSKEKAELNRNKVRLQAIGNLDKLPAKTQRILQESIDHLADNTGLTLTLALSYSGRSELVGVVKHISELVKQGTLRAEDVTEELLNEMVSTAKLPDLDLLIRTSGEHRLSNFLLWQLAYTELFFTPVLWPDFSKDDFFRAVMEFGSRQRRFGRIPALPAEQPRYSFDGLSRKNEICLGSDS